MTVPDKSESKRHNRLKRAFEWPELDKRAARYRERQDAPERDEESRAVVRAIFGEAAESYERDRALSAIRVHWRDIAGPLAVHAWPRRIRGKKLIVRAEKSVYAQEVSLYTSVLLEGIREIDPGIKEIRTETGPVDWPEEPEYVSEDSELSTEEFDQKESDQEDSCSRSSFTDTLTGDNHSGNDSGSQGGQDHIMPKTIMPETAGPTAGRRLLSHELDEYLKRK